MRAHLAPCQGKHRRSSESISFDRPMLTPTEPRIPTDLWHSVNRADSSAVETKGLRSVEAQPDCGSNNMARSKLRLRPTSAPSGAMPEAARTIAGSPAIFSVTHQPGRARPFDKATLGSRLGFGSYAGRPTGLLRSTGSCARRDRSDFAVPCAILLASAGCQNMVLVFFDVSGIGAITSQCSTSLPSFTRKISTPTSPFRLMRPVQ
jgi:hypothetical protein